ncbi:isocitrate lyase/phosphoenolpyruvate mutase family protein [Nitrosopumilus sp.]|uniref:isocitrate lyase/phosphoenolpyruvate mutase family protein n=1 Tax=Nitrosopumilus sp. TaxID=2024843 RepID=UPI00247BDE01|nr:isocitrate lyase/phosphoenolpyruvate mutase family protein [Nitrosopumilus sp.]MCV0430395.1 isocitrate lyase/phosphoenolpyruvate mutase family protein [Nitrosopumilus sp.]
MNSSSNSLRKKLAEQSIVKVGGAFDAMSAKLVEIHGFDAVWAGSFAISATHALPDASILTMTEFLHAASNMAESCNIPIIADCDTGFGGPSNVGHMVKKYEKAGIAAVSIEDKVFPKQNSLLEDGTQELLPEKDFVAKIIAGKDAKISNDFMIIARVEALIAGLGIDEAIKRATAYEKAGADAILIHSKKNTPQEIFEFSKKWEGNIPLISIPTSYPNVTTDELISNNFKMVIYANHTLRVSYLAMSKLLEDISKTNSLSKVEQEMSSMEEIFQLQEMYNIKKQEKEIEENLKKLGYVK